MMGHCASHCPNKICDECHEGEIEILGVPQTVDSKGYQVGDIETTCSEIDVEGSWL